MRILIASFGVRGKKIRAEAGVARAVEIIERLAERAGASRPGWPGQSSQLPVAAAL